MEVNDGNGLLDNIGLIDTLVIDCNDAVKSCMSGQYIMFCNIMVRMVQKLANLKSGVRSDLESREQTIKDYETRLAELGHPIEHLSETDVAEMIGEGAK